MLTSVLASAPRLLPVRPLNCTPSVLVRNCCLSVPVVGATSCSFSSLISSCLCFSTSIRCATSWSISASVAVSSTPSCSLANLRISILFDSRSASSSSVRSLLPVPIVSRPEPSSTSPTVPRPDSTALAVSLSLSGFGAPCISLGTPTPPDSFSTSVAWACRSSTTSSVLVVFSAINCSILGLTSFASFILGLLAYLLNSANASSLVTSAASTL